MCKILLLMFDIIFSRRFFQHLSCLKQDTTICLLQVRHQAMMLTSSWLGHLLRKVCCWLEIWALAAAHSQRTCQLSYSTRHLHGDFWCSMSPHTRRFLHNFSMMYCENEHWCSALVTLFLFGAIQGIWSPLENHIVALATPACLRDAWCRVCMPEMTTPFVENHSGNGTSLASWACGLALNLMQWPA